MEFAVANRSPAAIRHGTSNFKTLPHETYDTHDWRVGAALARRRHLLPAGRWWEPAAGRGCLVDELRTGGVQIGAATDLAPRRSDVTACDFLTATRLPDGCRIIATNAPFSAFNSFARHALRLTEPVEGGVALLLPITYVSAASRRDLFEHPAFVGHIVCAFRVDWFPGDRKASLPPTIYAWMLWNWECASPKSMNALAWPLGFLDFPRRPGLELGSFREEQNSGRT